MVKILLIDDDVFCSEAFIALLEWNGFQVIFAETGQLGLELAETQLPDLILCDIKMPKLDGYQVLNALRQNSATEKIPVIFLTGEATESVCRHARELGANDCLDKICSLQELIQAIEVQVKKHLPLSC